MVCWAWAQIKPCITNLCAALFQGVRCSFQLYFFLERRNNVRSSCSISCLKAAVSWLVTSALPCLTLTWRDSRRRSNSRQYIESRVSRSCRHTGSVAVTKLSLTAARVAQKCQYCRIAFARKDCAECRIERDAVSIAHNRTYPAPPVQRIGRVTAPVMARRVSPRSGFQIGGNSRQNVLRPASQPEIVVTVASRTAWARGPLSRSRGRCVRTPSSSPTRIRLLASRGICGHPPGLALAGAKSPAADTWT